jgi:plastocyanin
MARKAGSVAIPVILALGALTGGLTYYYFNAYMPTLSWHNTPYYEPLPPPGTASASGTSNNSSTQAATVDESKFTKKVEIKILQGASIQGNPNYDPDSATATSDALVTWTNADNTLHTVTSGTSASDASSGKLFDSKYLQPNAKYSVPASKIGKGDHDYYCQVHPYMKGKITVT